MKEYSTAVNYHFCSKAELPLKCRKVREASITLMQISQVISKNIHKVHDVNTTNKHHEHNFTIVDNVILELE